jgi:nucleoside 2-deoxyribosyltransferase
MAFGEPYVHLYNDVIKPVTRDQYKLKPINAGELFGRQISDDIVRGLQEARVVIAEVTPPNKNVFYELGYAHGLKKKTILLVKKGTEFPFDTHA